SVLNDINVPVARNGNTILGEAVRKKLLPFVELLLTIEGIDINKVNKKGQTPLDVVAMSSTFCSKSCKIAKLLLAQYASCKKTERVDLMLRMSIILRS
ncbi:unnamed protein product, partial [marine sediment metagenome]